jgi:hypothetical protein
MKLIVVIALFVTAIATSTAAEPPPAGELAPTCWVWWDWSEQYAHGVLCATDSEGSFPPSKLPVAEPSDPGAQSHSDPSVLSQQKSRRLPGGFFGLDVKTRD